MNQGPIRCYTTPGQSGPGSNGNERVLYIPQNSSITGTSPSDRLESYSGHLFGRGGSYLFAKKQSVYSTAPADWTMTLVEDDPKAPFSITTTPGVSGRGLLNSLDCSTLPLIQTL